MPVASSIVQPTSPTSAASRIVSATTSGASPKPFSRSAETGKSVASTISARASAPHPASGRHLFDQEQRRRQRSMWPMPGSQGRRECGWTRHPWIRNYEGPRPVVKCAEASCLFVLGDTHRSYLAIRSPPCYPLNYTDVLSPIRSSGWRSLPPIPVVLRGHRKEPINSSFADHPSLHRGRVRTVASRAFL